MSDIEVFKSQSLKEEISNAISHGIGAALFIAGTVIMIVQASIGKKGALAITGVSIFGASLILLYLTSCLYHSLTNYKAKKVFRKLDHCMIFLLITGTYTPICLSLIGGFVGWSVWGINMACTVLGVTLNAISVRKFDKISQILYIIMGWSILMASYSVIKVIPLPGLLLVLLGGILYTLGTLFYRKKDVKFSHFVWHLFVILGSLPHFAMILYYVCIK
ncbi:MAG: hemolysin III family protein [Lachnospiraceae bacterium]|nr:hemolysin III family protein [Lachnospiraceae bacterium]